jgi:glucosamine-6-phosphate deaminase
VAFFLSMENHANNPETVKPEGKYEEKEKIKTLIFSDSGTASRIVANYIGKRIVQSQKSNKKIVLGLATGSTPVALYKELVLLHKNQGLSFKNVVTFNLDEYYPMKPTDMQSYVRFMHENLFDLIDIKSENIHIPDGTVEFNEVDSFCDTYETNIAAHGGIDIQILGLGRTGHIGFNEPGSTANSKTRLINLDHITCLDAASDFFGEEHVPKRAITMGIGTILKAREIIIMAWGEGKSSVVARSIEGEISNHVPATYLQQHPHVTFYIDEAAAVSLTRVKSPWLVGKINWTSAIKQRAVIWLSRKLNKPILKLTASDYSENGMADLILEHETAYNLNINVFRNIQNTITGWPGGKPIEDDTHRPERAFPERKRVLLFSPHPDDDVISMGGTFLRLVTQGHEVHVAYQTSGNIAVFNEHVLQQMDFVKSVAATFVPESYQKLQHLFEKVVNEIKHKNIGEPDPAEILTIKGLIRKSEARAGCHFAGIPDKQIHFMDLPFYETGLIRKKPMGEADIHQTISVIEKIKPHQIFAAGDLSDPHGTHRVCLSIIFEAIDRLKTQSFMNECRVWLYRGAWQEWAVEDIEMAVPLSPDELKRKRKAIFKHQSQKDSALFPGADSREFWQRAEDRNRETASIYNQLGLAEYEAMEAFKRYHF